MAVAASQSLRHQFLASLTSLCTVKIGWKLEDESAPRTTSEDSSWKQSISRCSSLYSKTFGVSGQITAEPEDRPLD